MTTLAEYDERWEDLKQLQKHYPDFRDFYADVSEALLGFTPTWMQYDMADYIANGDMWSMVQAQRGEAKTTIAGCYAVWCLIHDPTTRVLILSAGSSMAKQISIWCIQIINNLDFLECLRGDKSHPGTRASVEAYDVHHDLKGANKSPSIACLGITSNMQGYRADLLIPDDIESSKNALTQLMREQLRHLTRDFSSINSDGKILYLGTPQSVDSIYNDLTSRDFDVRIYPGRYPSEKDQEEVYGDCLAPALIERMEANPSLRTGCGVHGDLGAPTDAGMMSERVLCKKELDQGKAYFNLQFMLNTSLMDQDKFPLKLNDLMFYDFDLKECPGKFSWTNDTKYQIPMPSGTSIPKERIFKAGYAHDEYFNYSMKVMAIDPAGGGQHGDETGIAIVYECNGFLIVQHVSGIKGGTKPEQMADVIKLLKQYDINQIIVERNFGDGAFAEALRGYMLQAEYNCDIEEVWAAGQKELRIADTVSPVIESHKLVLSTKVIEHDVTSTMHYPAAQRASFQLLFQMAKLTRERGALIHDDRLDALTMAIKFLMSYISINADKEIAKKKQRKLDEYMKDPNGLWRHSHTTKAALAQNSMGNALGRFNGRNITNKKRR